MFRFLLLSFLFDLVCVCGSSLDVCLLASLVVGLADLTGWSVSRKRERGRRWLLPPPFSVRET